jgi:hypothetical protein
MEETAIWYWVCQECGHYWGAQFDPMRCENCHGRHVSGFDDLDRAEEASEAICEGYTGP